MGFTCSEDWCNQVIVGFEWNIQVSIILIDGFCIINKIQLCLLTNSAKHGKGGDWRGRVGEVVSFTFSEIKEDDFRTHKGGPPNYICYYTLLEIIIHNLSTTQYDTQSQQVKIQEYAIRKEKEMSLWLFGSHIWGNFRPL